MNGCSVFLIPFRKTVKKAAKGLWLKTYETSTKVHMRGLVSPLCEFYSSPIFSNKFKAFVPFDRISIFGKTSRPYIQMLSAQRSPSSVEYREVYLSESRDIARLAVCLTNEIIERTGIKHFDVDIPLAEKLCDEFLGNGQYSVLAAFDGSQIIGFGAMCESNSLYAEGTFGIIQEFYVLPAYRSKSVGKELLREIVKFSKLKKWVRLELCTPPVPEFEKTVKFYKENGFEITGGYKMKCVIA